VETAKDADAAYGAESYKAFNKKNIQPYVKARSVHIFQLDEVKWGFQCRARPRSAKAAGTSRPACAPAN
jgi:hypothetical protein